MPQENEAKQTPPYATYASFKRFINQLAESLVPDQVDDHALSKFSGSEKAALVPTLKFLGLVDDSKSPTDDLKALVKAIRSGDDNWREALRRLLERGYKGITDGIDMERGTGAQLDKAFRDMGVAASVLPKCARFYLQAIEDTGVTLSPYMKTKRRASSKKRTPPKNGPAKTEEKKPEKRTTPSPSGGKDQTEKGFARQDIPTIEGAYIIYPVAMSEEDFQLFEAALQFIRAVTQKGGQR